MSPSKDLTLRMGGGRHRLAQGVPMEDICLYHILNHPGWDDDRHCHNGLFDYAQIAGHREVFVPLANELSRDRICGLQWLL